jgi:hypothetical protein
MWPSLTNKLKPVSGKPLTFTTTGIKLVNPVDVIFQPFFKIHDSRYMMYWMTLSNSQYHSYLDSLGIIEKEKLALQQRTIDFVAAGEHNQKQIMPCKDKTQTQA